MNNLRTIKNLTQLLVKLKEQKMPMFVSLCSRCGDDNFLMDQVIHKVQEKYGTDLGYEKLPETASKIIQDEFPTPFFQIYCFSKYQDLGSPKC